jgi:hypothetical protein
MPLSNYELRDEELSARLAKDLSDYEFEMLLRMRIKQGFDRVMAVNPNLGENHFYCIFQYKWDDKSKWDLALGGSYNDRVNISGEVLAITLDDCNEIWKKQNRNKLSFLLPG